LYGFYYLFRSNTRCSLGQLSACLVDPFYFLYIDGRAPMQHNGKTVQSVLYFFQDMELDSLTSRKFIGAMACPYRYGKTITFCGVDEHRHFGWLGVAGMFLCNVDIVF